MTRRADIRHWAALLLPTTQSEHGERVPFREPSGVVPQPGPETPRVQILERTDQ